MNGGCDSRLSRPGSWTGQTSTSAGMSSDHRRKIEAPPPAYGKQNRRTWACGFGLGQVIHALVMAVRFRVMHAHIGFVEDSRGGLHSGNEITDTDFLTHYPVEHEKVLLSNQGNG